MSSNRVGSVASTAAWSTNGSALPIRTPNSVKPSRRTVFRAPKTVQEKVLCYALCLILIVMMVFLAALCIVADRWRAILSKFSYSYVKEDVVCNTDPCKETAEKLLSNLDMSTDPCEDFYQFACGGWMEKHPIPESREEIGAFEERGVEVEALEDELLESLDSNLTTGPKTFVSMRNLYRGCLDTEARNVTGVAPLADLLQILGGWPMLEGESWDDSGYSWYKYAAVASRKLLVDVFTELNLVETDDDDTYELYLRKADFLFDEEDYNEIIQDPHSNRSRELVDIIVHAARLLGSKVDTDKLHSEARKLILFEYGLSLMIDKRLDGKPRKFESRTLKELDENATKTLERDKDFSYKELLKLIIGNDAQVNDSTIIYVKYLDYLLELPSYMDVVQPRQIADYIAYTVVDVFSQYTVENFYPVEENDTDDSVDDRYWVVEGCKAVTRRFMKSAFYRLFAENQLPPIAKYHVNKMVDMIRLAYSSTLDQTTWMDKSTMLYSLVKLKSIGSHVGFSSWIWDDELLDGYYQQVLDITEDDYFIAIVKLCEMKGEKKFAKWKKTVDGDDTLSDSDPLAVNAFYLPWTNEMVLPAGILGYPFYKFGRIDSINYGGLGSIIGHEISHAFDANGRHYDHEGRLVNWWTKEAEEQFLAKAECFINQYTMNSSDVPIDGNETLSENIADNGGMRNAFKAFRLHLALSDEDMTHRKVLPGLPATPEQLFFLGYAAIWCSNMTEDYAKYLSEKDEHGPSKLRVNVPLSNFKEFARAFECKPGTPMNPKNWDKCELW